MAKLCGNLYFLRVVVARYIEAWRNLFRNGQVVASGGGTLLCQNVVGKCIDVHDHLRTGDIDRNWSLS